MKNKKVTDVCVVKNWKLWVSTFYICDFTQPWITSFILFISTLILLLEIVGFENNLYSFQWNWGYYRIFKINRKLIKYSKWQPPLTINDQISKALGSLGSLTFAQAHLSLRPGTEISCAGSNNDLCTIYKNSECCCEAVSATMAHLGNHQGVVLMRQNMLPVRRNKIPQ